MLKYAIHPGHIVSANDGQTHYISYGDLVHLYNVDPRLCFRWIEANGWRRNYDDYTHLYPRYDGNYIVDHKEDTLNGIRQALQTGSRLDKICEEVAGPTE